MAGGEGGGCLLFPGWWKLGLGLVVAGQSVDTALNQNQSEFGILVLFLFLVYVKKLKSDSIF